MTFDNEGRASRDLPYSLDTPVVPDRIDNPSGVITNITTQIFPSDPDEQIEIVLQLSFNEYTALASAIDIGRDIAFGEDSFKLWFAWVRSLVGVPTLNCDDVANCIDTSAPVQLAIINEITNEGYAPSPNNSSTTNVTLSPEKQAEDLLPVSYTCEDAHLMATARQIILEFHNAVLDFFEAIELLTNPVEAANIATDGVPVAGTINNVTELIDWLIETVTETYTAAYNQEVEDELACALFCLMRVDCELTYDMLLGMYSDYAEAENASLPSNLDDFQSVADWAVGLTLTVSVGCVATIHYLLVLAMKFGAGTVFQLAGLTSLKSLVAMTVSYEDFSYEDCDCITPDTPTDYWMLYMDFRQSKYGTTNVNASDGNLTKYDANGWQANKDVAATTSNASFTVDDWGADVIVKAAATRSLRRGSIGNGSNDYNKNLFYPSANRVGTVQTFTTSGITQNTNNVEVGQINAANSVTARSFQCTNRTSGDPQVAGELKVFEFVVWGAKGAGDTKPNGAVWSGNTLPSTVPELFPDYVAP